MRNFFIVLLIALFQLSATAGNAQVRTADTTGDLVVGNFRFYRAAIVHSVEKRLEIFNRNVSILITKKDPRPEDVVNKTLKQFLSDTTKVSVTSLRFPKPVIKTIRKYLYNLSQLPYDSVSVTDHGVVFISNLVANPDGTFRGEARFIKDFTGYIENSKAYADQVETTVSVIIKVVDEVIDGKQSSRCIIYLGDMKIQETRSI